MAMHVVGRAPTSKRGEYFRLSFARWRLLHQLMRERCADLIDAGTLEEMVYNHGAGVAAPELCPKIAGRLYHCLSEDEWPSLYASLSAPVSPALSALAAAPPADEDQPDEDTVKQDLAKWITFLQNCGGFAVW